VPPDYQDGGGTGAKYPKNSRIRNAKMEKRNISQAHWWKGTRGEWYVVAQIVLLAWVFFGPRDFPGWILWRKPWDTVSVIAGGMIILAGLALFITAIMHLGSNLTPVPYPKEDGTLIETGPYRFVRHPIYCAVLLIAFGWAFLVHGWLTLGYAIIMLVFFDIKSRREEQWLKAKFPGYGGYQKRVHKLIPFVY
jgi:protein-S-isoprenylcysteine O-methyltransferase Ste14